MKNQIGNAWVVVLVYLAIVIVAGYGWIENILKIVHSDFSPINGMLVARCIGVFVAPLGAVLGYC